METTRPYTFDRVVRILIGSAVLIILFLLVKRLSSVLLPFFIAWLMAYLLHPFVRFFQYKLKLKNRILSIVCTLVLFLSIITGILMVLVPMISNEVQKLIDIIGLYTQGITVDTVIPIAWQNEIRVYVSQLDLQSVLKDENLMAVIKKVAPQLWNILNGSISVIIGTMAMVIVFLYLIFILIDYEKVTKGMFDDCVSLRTTVGLFSNCYDLKIKLVGEGFKNTQLVNVSRMFENSGLYGTIPYRLFFMRIDNGNGTYTLRKTITDMSNIFNGC